MSRHSTPRSRASRLQRQLDRVLPRQRKTIVNENIVCLEKNGDISFERVRTVGSGSYRDQNAAEADNSPSVLRENAQSSANSNFVPHFVPQTPMIAVFGNLIRPGIARIAGVFQLSQPEFRATRPQIPAS